MPSLPTQGSRLAEVDQGDHKSRRRDIEVGDVRASKVPSLQQGVQNAPEQHGLRQIRIACYLCHDNAERFEDRIARGKADDTSNQFEEFDSRQHVTRSNEACRIVVTHE